MNFVYGVVKRGQEQRIIKRKRICSAFWFMWHSFCRLKKIKDT